MSDHLSTRDQLARDIYMAESTRITARRAFDAADAFMAERAKRTPPERDPWPEADRADEHAASTEGAPPLEPQRWCDAALTVRSIPHEELTCARRAGHAGDHKDASGQQWSAPPLPDLATLSDMEPPGPLASFAHVSEQAKAIAEAPEAAQVRAQEVPRG